ncbi:MAG: transcription-repair coupling factor, partial [Duncaniella sp.]|nr:transcription-repair coupling factor [Duncaniella sp.]
MISIQQLSDEFMSSRRREALEKALGGEAAITSVYNLAGSSPALMLAALPPRKVPTVVVGDSLDDAGYIYHDLSRILGEDRVLLFPSGYKRDIKYGQVDPPSQILRTEALNQWHSDRAPVYVVTYPEALAEKVARREVIDRHTLHLRKDSETDMTETIAWLRENGFLEVDYVYEPGQFASRGSILDIFGYSHELPFRVDFFGDEIDSIRTFNIETQLSEKQLQEIAVTSGVASQSSGESLLEYVDPSTLFVVRDALYTVERVKAIGAEELSQSALAAVDAATDTNAMKQVVDGDAFARRFSSFRQLRFTAAARPDTAAKASIDFHCSPQVIYHKNFELISESFSKFLAEGYRIYILSDSEKQIERLKVIFSDRGDSIDFAPVMPTVHEGFTDHSLKICVFTDHQIFDRFHKYTLKSDRARSGKLALSLKELSAIEPGD